MADYYSILKKTIASLPENNGAARRSVYSRARNAIVNQLKAYEPPLAPSEITAEQLRLEEAIRKVEAEAARESLGLGAPPVKPTAPAPAPEPAAPPVVDPSVAEDTVAPEAETIHASVAPPSDAAPSINPSQPVYEQETPSPLKETLAEAETLGTAASQATQSARDVVAPQADQQPTESVQPRQEPSFGTQQVPDDELFEPALHTEAGADAASIAAPEAAGKSEKPATKAGKGRRSKPRASDALKTSRSSNIMPIAAALVLVVILAGVGAYFLLPGGDQSADSGNTTQPTETQTATSAQPEPAAPEPAQPEAAPDADSSKNTDRLLDDGNGDVVAPDARTVTTTLITPQATPAAPDEPAIASTSGDAPLAEPTVPAIAEQPALAVPEDNLAAISPEETTPSAAADTSEGGAQRSILYEEGEESGGAGTAAQGAVVWTLDEETNLEGQSQAVLSASVEIPERDVIVDIRIKPNDDTSLPASHLVEIKYEFPETFAAGDVVNVPGLVMKPTEEARGDALIGASVKVSPGFFWIALSSLPNEQQRNLALLRERGWIDIPMLYENGKRGILTLEKGTKGADVVEKAIAAWQAG